MNRTLNARLAKLENVEGGMGFPWHVPFKEWPEAEQERAFMLLETDPHCLTDEMLNHIEAGLDGEPEGEA